MIGLGIGISKEPLNQTFRKPHRHTASFAVKLIMENQFIHNGKKHMPESYPMQSSLFRSSIIQR